jgi:hypothetical protein
MNLRLATALSAALLAAACSTPRPRPLPGGPPPEYEPPRGYDAGIADSPAEPPALPGAPLPAGEPQPAAPP